MKRISFLYLLFKNLELAVKELADAPHETPILPLLSLPKSLVGEKIMVLPHWELFSLLGEPLVGKKVMVLPHWEPQHTITAVVEMARVMAVDPDPPPSHLAHNMNHRIKVTVLCRRNHHVITE